jgi:hypothetical protein
MNLRLARNAVQPLAVLVLLLAAVAAPALSLAHEWRIASPVWAAVVASAVAASGRSVRRGAAIAAGFAFAWCVTVAATLVVYAITIDTSLCGKHVRHAWVAWGIAGAVYVAIGLWGFRGVRRPLWAWPLAVAVAWAVGVALAALLPGSPGVCET